MHYEKKLFRFQHGVFEVFRYYSTTLKEYSYVLKILQRYSSSSTQVFTFKIRTLSTF